MVFTEQGIAMLSSVLRSERAVEVNIAIMRTFGMTRGAILRIFFICGAAIGVTGTLIGVIAGVLFTVYIQEIQGVVEMVSGTSVWDPELRYLTRLPAVLQWGDVALTCSVSLAFALLATLYPARRAAKLDPVEALRYE